MKTYFLSDAHLGCLAIADNRAHEKKLVKWLDTIEPDCEALYLLGDILDFWFEYKQVVPKGFVRFFGKLAAMTDKGIPVHWFCGNHDIWMFRYVQEELGVIVHTDSITTTIYGKSFFLSHGDGLGDPSVSFKILRKTFHNKFNQWLFSKIHPDLSIAFGYKWARNSRLKRINDPETYLGEDKEYLVQFAKKHLQSMGDEVPDYYIFGHRHIMLDLMLSSKNRLCILGDWFNQFSYGVFDGTDFSLELFEEV